MILFDLDGTLVQTREASWRVFEKVNRRFDLGVNSPEAFYALSEVNLFAGLREKCGDDERAREVTDFFFHLLLSEYRPPIIPGMRSVVKTLAAEFPLSVVSSNAMGAIRHVLDDAGLTHCFGHVFSGDVEPDKEKAIQKVLGDPSYGLGRRGTPEYDETGGHHSGDVVLITDTVGDVKAAMAAGARAVGVSWGMHTAAQLQSAGAEFVAIWPEELLIHFRESGGGARHG
ncbi:HAD hydrolase-like protein [Paraburkholderia sp. Ac-20347]|uniref:HAD family hydrolase n=1 Tax=Paraburkholderia sp. Ac-20347 TaxID=2703892 RepID=UPI001981D542|nr:HAD hydrolase-like protein [Paraburkholderia sp. Ac-20347]MBN3808852.1 HAD family hydrolase [Paraburkholderia sp. Ac-20347]